MSDSDDERWRRLKELFAEAISIAPADRVAWLARLPDADAALRGDLDNLIRAHESAEGLLDTPALASPDLAQAVVSATAPPVEPAPLRCGPYRIIRELGRGGMGVVYLGARDDAQFEKEVAIKVVSSALVHPLLIQRFHDERRILATLDHPNIARLLDSGTTDAGLPYVVMELVEGEPIDVYCTGRRLTVRERLALFIRVCGAVQYSHQRLVVHRDIKARNVLVTRDGVPKLLDFGIAKLLEPGGIDPQSTRTMFRALTPESASPEQVRGEPVTLATDVYSLGVLLYRLLTERSPYRGGLTTETAILHAICDEEPQRPSDAVTAREDGQAPPVSARDLRGDLDVITLKALKKDPARRYTTVDQLSDDLARYESGRPVHARPDSWRYRAGKFVARHKAAAAAAALVTISLVAGILMTSREARIASAERARAERRFNDVRRLANSVLFEFHDAIAPLPGSTKVRELLVQRATEYLDSLSKESSNDPTLQRELAAAYDRVGDVQGLPSFPNLGHTAQALESHRRALALREALASAPGADAGLQVDLIATYSHMSSLLGQIKDGAGSLEYARRTLAIREKLLAKNPDGVRERRGMSASYHQIGAILASTRDLPGALDNYRRSQSFIESVLKQTPSDQDVQRDLSILYKQTGAVLETMGDGESALVDYRKSVDLDESRVAANVNDNLSKLDLSYGYASIGYTLSRRGDVNGSLENYRRALALRQQVADADPHDVNAGDTVTRAYLSIGQVLRGANRFEEAMAEFRRAASRAEARHAADASNGPAEERLANIYGAMAGTEAALAGASKNPADAARLCRETRDWSRKAVEIWNARQNPTTEIKAEIESLEKLGAKCDEAAAKLRAARK